MKFVGANYAAGHKKETLNIPNRKGPAIRRDLFQSILVRGMKTIPA